MDICICYSEISCDIVDHPAAHHLPHYSCSLYCCDHAAHEFPDQETVITDRRTEGVYQRKDAVRTEYSEFQV